MGSVATEAPVAVEESVATEAPGAVEESVVTEAPGAVEESVVTEAPGAVEESVVTEAPVAVEESVVTEAPVAVEKSVATVAPVDDAIVAALDAPVIAPRGVSGAIFTTTRRPGRQQKHLRVQGRRLSQWRAQQRQCEGLRAGTYFVQVTATNGTPLGTTIGTVTVGVDGRFVNVYSLTALVGGFADSDNGEYKVWLSTTAVFKESESKTDNFRVVEPDETPPPPVPPTGETLPPAPPTGETLPPAPDGRDAASRAAD